MRALLLSSCIVLAFDLASPCASAQTEIRAHGGTGQFGSSVAGIGDIDGDGRSDYAVGQGQLFPLFSETKAWVFSGATGTQLYELSSPGTFDGFGFSVGGVGDVDDDGVPDIAVGAPLDSENGGYLRGSVHIFSGADGSLLHYLTGAGDVDLLGWSVRAAGDVDGDGHGDFIAGATEFFIFETSGTGYVRVYSGVDGSVLYHVPGRGTFERFGTSVDGGVELDGDGVPDFMATVGVGWGVRGFSGVDGSLLFELAIPCTVARFAGDVDEDGRMDYLVGEMTYSAGDEQSIGRARLFSGADFSVIYEHTGSDDFDFFGAAVSALGDVDEDGIPDFVVGAPTATNELGSHGYVRVFTGRNGAQLYEMRADTDIQTFGTALDAVGDVDLDGVPDFLVGDPTDNTVPGNWGWAFVFRGFDPPGAAYCTAKVNSQGCTPAIAFDGIPSATHPGGFKVGAVDVLNNQPGMLFYGFAAASVPFQGGTRCVANPIRRTPPQSSHGNPPPADCSGTYAFPFNTWIQSGIDPELLPGVTVYAQYWTRDPASQPFGTGLTDAVEFTIFP